MKKVLLAFAILGFVACNNEAEKTEGTDTTSTTAPAPEGTGTTNDSSKVSTGGDSSKVKETK